MYAISFLCNNCQPTPTKQAFHNTEKAERFKRDSISQNTYHDSFQYLIPLEEGRRNIMGLTAEQLERLAEKKYKSPTVTSSITQTKTTVKPLDKAILPPAIKRSKSDSNIISYDNFNDDLKRNTPNGKRRTIFPNIPIKEGRRNIMDLTAEQLKKPSAKKYKSPTVTSSTTQTKTTVKPLDKAILPPAIKRSKSDSNIIPYDYLTRNPPNGKRRTIFPNIPSYKTIILLSPKYFQELKKLQKD